MELETARYLINYFSHLLTGAENMAIKHTTTLYKAGRSISGNAVATKMYREKGWLTDDEQVLDLLKDGYETFELNVAGRILARHPEKVFLNYGPNCGKLARTPQARHAATAGITGAIRYL